MARRRFSREFKGEAVKLVLDRDEHGSLTQRPQNPAEFIQTEDDETYLDHHRGEGRGS